MDGKVKCEYCGSYVDAGSNCPNCGAVLPCKSEGSVLDSIARLGQAAYKAGVTISIEMYREGLITANELRQIVVEKELKRNAEMFRGI